ncbi:MAG TPA: LysR family transcriptional regulator [Micrococcales bacterium]|nr:LysR substrate-binding domain-containing protein [Miniimonas arenae]HCX83756.1 LysR family transcriptional regulator [Micrococcales bacterium]
MTPDGEHASRLRLAVVPGVSPGRWVDTWRERYPAVPLDLFEVPASGAEATLLAATADAAFLRLPLASGDLARIPLWVEETVVALPREHVLTLLEELTPGDLAEETLLVPADDVLHWSGAPGERFVGRAPATTADALELVGAEAGVCVLPRALARALHRRDVELRPLRDAPTSQVGLAWRPAPDGGTPPLVDDLIGVVRGRTAASTRGRDRAGGRDEPDGGGRESGARAAGKRDGGRGSTDDRRGGRPPGDRRHTGSAGPRSGGRRRGR